MGIVASSPTTVRQMLPYLQVSSFNSNALNHTPGMLPLEPNPVGAEKALATNTSVSAPFVSSPFQNSVSLCSQET